MDTFVRNCIRLITTISVTLVVLALPDVPTASAAPVPWTWKRVTVPVSVAPFGYYSVDATCPAGYTAITGGLQLPEGSRLFKSAEYRYWDGSGWFVAFENDSDAYGSATVVAECVETADLPPISWNGVTLTSNSWGYTSGSVSCANPGEVVLTGGVDWSNVNTRQIYHSGPAWNETQWVAEGWNSVGGAKMHVEVYCVDPSYVPGFQKIETGSAGGGNFRKTLTCPVGKRILNGGTQEGPSADLPQYSAKAYASYPNLNTWTASFYHPWSGMSTYVRAICVNAGSPTVQLTSASPGNGAVTTSRQAIFQMAGSDPAGFSNGFVCSLDGAPYAPCGSTKTYASLLSGPHTFTVVNRTADGRESVREMIQWIVDADAPGVSAPTLKPVTLTQAAEASWSGVDQQTGIDRYEAAYWLGHADGATVDWTQSAGWQALSTPSVQLPTMAPGDTLCLAVRAVDKAGNKSEWTTPSCTSRPFDDRALTPSSDWTRGTGSSYWLQTVTSTTASAKTLKRHGVHLDGVGILASTCPGCGIVDVKVDRATIGRVNLKTASALNRQVLLLPAFAKTDGTITVKSVSSGKRIRIDGLVVIRTTSSPPVLP